MAGWVAAAVVGTSLISSKAASNAAETQAAATGQAADLQYRMWQEQQKSMQPWLTAGETALNKLTPLATNYTKFGMDQFNEDPGYAFRVSEGQKALDRTAAARGGLISGGALKAATRFGQDMGSQEYQNAFNRYQTERAAQLAPLQSLAGLGQSSANTLGNAASTYGTNAGNLITSGGAAQAAGQVGQANAVTGGLSTYLNYNQGNNLLSAINRNRPTYGVTGDPNQFA